MDYRQLIREAWVATWRYRFLWVLGILAGGGVGVPTLNGGTGGSGTGWRIEQTELEQMSPRGAAALRAVTDWSIGNVGLLVIAAVLFAAFLVVVAVRADATSCKNHPTAPGPRRVPRAGLTAAVPAG